MNSPIPTELLTIIIDYVEQDQVPPNRIKTLKSIARCSKSTSSLTTPYLFQSARFGNVSEHKACAKFYSLKPTRQTAFQSVAAQNNQNKKRAKAKADDLASFVKKLDVFIEIPDQEKSGSWLREKRIGDCEELLHIDRFPNFRKVTELNLKSSGPRDEEMRDQLSEIIRLLSLRLKSLTLDFNSFLSLLDIHFKLFDQEIEAEEWPTDLTFMKIDLSSKPDEPLPSKESIQRAVILAFKLLSRSENSKENLIIHLDFGETFHSRTMMLLRMMLLKERVLHFNLEGKKIRKSISFTLNGGMKVSNKEAFVDRAKLFEEELFGLKGKLVERPLKDYKIPDLFQRDLGVLYEPPPEECNTQ